MISKLSNLKNKGLKYIQALKAWFFGLPIKTRKIYLGSIGFLILLFLFVKISTFLKEEKSQQAFSTAKSIPDLEKLIRKYPKTSAGTSAAIFLAQEQWQTGQKATSILTLEKVIKNKKYPAIHTLFLMKSNYEFFLGRKKEAEKTLQTFLKSAEKNNDFYPLVLIRLGDIQKLSSKEEMAKASYQKVITEFPNSPFIQTAESRLLLFEISKKKERIEWQ